MRLRRARRVRRRDEEATLISAFLAAGEGDRPVTSSYEDWCDAQGVRPEAWGAWEAYQASLARLGDRPAR
jgi:hypothetical protein